MTSQQKVSIGSYHTTYKKKVFSCKLEGWFVISDEKEFVLYW